jgi:hypothetical protein
MCGSYLTLLPPLWEKWTNEDLAKLTREEREKDKQYLKQTPLIIKKINRREEKSR